jgi:hypothetical protein
VNQKRRTTGTGLAFGAVLALWLAAPVCAAPVGTVTIMDGKAHVARGTAVHALAEGGTLEEGDIIELEEGALLQVELADGSAMSFAGAAKALMPTPASSGERLSDVLLLSGWAKFNLASAANLPAVRTPLLRLISQNVSYVMQVAPDGNELFVETGELVPVFMVSRSGQPAVIKAGEYLNVKADASATTAGRPPQPFVKAMPRPYLDKLPQRLPKLKARGVEFKRERDVSFAEVDGWIKIRPAGRPAYLAQFKPMLKDKVFLRDLEPAIKNYPEWDRIVHPEKHRSKQKPQPQPK